jgi:hypothetical protein
VRVRQFDAVEDCAAVPICEPQPTAAVVNHKKAVDRVSRNGFVADQRKRIRDERALAGRSLTQPKGDAERRAERQDGKEDIGRKATHSERHERVRKRLFVQRLWREILTVRPSDRSSLDVSSHLSEVPRIRKRFEDAPPGLGREVDVSNCPVVEQQTKDLFAQDRHTNNHR